MELLWVVCILFILTFFTIQIEGFNPYFPDTRPTAYPDQSYSGDLLLAQKHIQNLINTNSDKSPYLLDLLNLLQFI